MWGVTLTSKKNRRTTIELDEGLYKRVKALALERDMTMKEIISEALEEKLKKEEERKEASNSDFLGNPVVRKVVGEMERFISREAAMLLFRTKCEKRGINPAHITEDDLTEEFLESLCTGMKFLSDINKKDCMEALRSCIGGD